LLAAFVTDLGAVETLSTGEIQLAKGIAMVCLECEKMEKDALAGADLDIPGYAALTRTLVSSMNILGLGRRPPTLSLADYVDLANKTIEGEQMASPSPTETQGMASVDLQGE
jgi:hypothetical protein